MNDSSDTKVSYKLFAYKGIECMGIVTIKTVINDNNTFFIEVCGERKYFQFSEIDTKPIEVKNEQYLNKIIVN